MFEQNINTWDYAQMLMTRRYYIDTAIWRDLHENRKDKSKHLGELAFELFRKIRVNKEKILYSDFVVEEMSHAYDKQTIEKIFREVSALLDRAEISEKQVKEAADLLKQQKLSQIFNEKFQSLRQNAKITIF